MEGDRILDELRRVDELTLRFNPLGLGGRMEPASSARFLRDSIASAVLAETVPEDVRLNFERVRKLHLYGVLDYDFFSVAIDEAHLVLEGALRHRFVSYYGGEIPVLRDGVAETLSAPSFDYYYDTLRRARKKKAQLRLQGSGEPLPSGLRDLFAWARRRGLLPGQRNAIVFHSLAKLRNYTAHPERNDVNMPPESARLLREVAEIINKLWGHGTHGGRLYPTPLARRPRAAALRPDREAAVEFASLELVRAEEERRDWMYAVFLAAADEDLVDFIVGRSGYRFCHAPGFQTTRYPCELLWGPGSWADLLATLDTFAGVADDVEYLDRLFFVRANDGSIDMPRASADLEAAEDPGDATWHAVLADHPLDAWQHVRSHEPGEARAGDTCTTCHANTLARLETLEAARRFAEGMRPLR
jgi:hypothetical protein